MSMSCFGVKWDVITKDESTHTLCYLPVRKSEDHRQPNLLQWLQRRRSTVVVFPRQAAPVCFVSSHCLLMLHTDSKIPCLGLFAAVWCLTSCVGNWLEHCCPFLINAMCHMQGFSNNLMIKQHSANMCSAAYSDWSRSGTVHRNPPWSWSELSLPHSK